EQTFILDLNQDFYSKYSLDGVIYDLPVNYSVSPEKNKIKGEGFEIDFGKVLFHQIPIMIENVNDKLKIHEDILPLKGSFDVKWIRNLSNIDLEKDQVYLVSGSKPKFVGGKWNNWGIE